MFFEPNKKIYLWGGIAYNQCTCSYGADPNLANAAGETPVTLAEACPPGPQRTAMLKLVEGKLRVRRGTRGFFYVLACLLFLVLFAQHAERKQGQKKV